MKISTVSVQRPVFATVVSLLLVILGLLAFTRLSVRELPEVESPIVSIETTRLRRIRSAIRWRALVNRKAFGWVGSARDAASYTRAYSSWRRSTTSSRCGQRRSR